MSWGAPRVRAADRSAFPVGRRGEADWEGTAAVPDSGEDAEPAVRFEPGVSD